MSSETLTRKEALVAILEGTHWWKSEHFEVAFRDNAVWAARKFKLENYELSSWAFSITYILQSSWTRGEPVEVEE